MSDFSSNTWAIALGGETDTPLLFRYRKCRPPEFDPSEFRFALRIVWPYDGHGMPSATDNELQTTFEEAIALIPEEIGRLMIVSTGNGQKDWLYYVRDPDEWFAALNELLAEHEPYPISIADWIEEDWSTWQEFVDNSVSDD